MALRGDRDSFASLLSGTYNGIISQHDTEEKISLIFNGKTGFVGTGSGGLSSFKVKGDISPNNRISFTKRYNGSTPR